MTRREFFLSSAASALVANSLFSWHERHSWQRDVRWAVDVWNCSRCGINVPHQHVVDHGFPKTLCWGLA